MSLIISLLHKLDALQISTIMLWSYLLFYTMYDKQQKQLVSTNLIDVITLRKGLDHTLVELNKAISLAGLSVLGVAFLPVFRREMYNLIMSGMIQLVIHTAYSSYKYYGSKNLPYLTSFVNLKDQWMKKSSVIYGSLAHLVIVAGYMGYLSIAAALFFGILFGLLHFYFMEIDYKFILRVRPFAYIVFPLCAAGMMYSFLIALH